MLCVFVPSLSACFKKKISISYSHITLNNSISINDLPKDSQVSVEPGYSLKALSVTKNLKPVEYRVYTSDTEFKNIYPSQIINENTSIVVVWENENYNLQIYNDLDTIINKIKRLEEISNSYNQEKNSTKDATLRVLQYIRQARYVGFEWGVVAGTMESDFSSYVQQHQGEFNLQSLQTIQNFTSPKTKPNKNNDIDFVHMLAVVNVILYGDLENFGYNDLASWGVDMCQLAIELKNTELTGSELQAQADSMFNNTTSSFSCYDVLANSDAFAIAKLHKELNQPSLATTFEYYYKLTNFDKRNENFLKIVFPELYENNNTDTTQQDLADIVYERVTNNTLIGVWCFKQGIDIDSLTTQLYASASSFAKYYLS